MDICDRINQIIEHEGMTTASFARKTGIGDQTVRSVVVLKRNKPGYDFLFKIAQTFEWLNIEWLITGLGDMELKKGNESFISIEHNAQISDTLNNLLNYLREKDDKIERLIEEKSMWQFKYQALHNNQ